MATTLSACAGMGWLPKFALEECLGQAGIQTTPRWEDTTINGGYAQRILPGPNATPQQAAAANACIERAMQTYGRPQGSTTGRPQETTTTQTDGAVTVVTYTYGTPPASTPAQAPRPATAAAPAPVAASAPATPASPRGGGPRTPSTESCNVQMVGGTGYVCRP